MSNGDSVVLSSHKQPRRRFTHKRKGKKKMPDYDTGRDESDRSESNFGKDDDLPSEKRLDLAKRTIKSTE